MTVNMKELPEYIIEDAARRLGWQEADDTESIETYLEQLAQMSAKQVFDNYCAWNGLVGWGNTLFDTVVYLQKATK